MPLLYDEEPTRRPVAPALGTGVRRGRVACELATVLLSAVNNAHRACGLEVGDRLSEIHSDDVDGLVGRVMAEIKDRIAACSPPPPPEPAHPLGAAEGWTPILAPRADPPAEPVAGLPPAAIFNSLGWSGLEDQAVAVAPRLATPGQRDAVRAVLGHRILRLVNNAYRTCGIDVDNVRGKDHSDQVHGFVGVILEDLTAQLVAAHAAIADEVETLVRRRDTLRAQVNELDAEIDRRRNP